MMGGMGGGMAGMGGMGGGMGGMGGGMGGMGGGMGGYGCRLRWRERNRGAAGRVTRAHRQAHQEHAFVTR